jgi:hypothetical protein
MSLDDPNAWYIAENGVGFGNLEGVLKTALTRLKEVRKAVKDGIQERALDRLEVATRHIERARFWTERNMPRTPYEPTKHTYMYRSPPESDG